MATPNLDAAKPVAAPGQRRHTYQDYLQLKHKIPADLPFDEHSFAQMAARFAAGAWNTQNQRAHTAPTAVRQHNITLIDRLTDDQCRQLTQTGQDSIQRGELALVVLNGGMATRFGSCVKGIQQVLPDISFLGLKLRMLKAVMPQVPVFLLQSFATDRATRQHLSAHDYFGINPHNIAYVMQNAGVRLTPKGEPFLTCADDLCMYAPGHGDALLALKRSIAFERFVARGGRTVMLCNVDNLAAVPTALLLGAHLHHPKAISIEAVERFAQDTGGALTHNPATDAASVTENARMPARCSWQTYPWFNTNTFWIDAKTLLTTDISLPWYVVEKQIKGRTGVQFEQMLADITQFVPAHTLAVPRKPAILSRFEPVKSNADLQEKTHNAQILLDAAERHARNDTPDAMLGDNAPPAVRKSA